VSGSADATTRFFDELAARGHERGLEQTNGTIRFELAEGSRTAQWLVTIRRGDVSVSRADEAGDCTVRADRALFDGIASGEVNAMAALLRGALVIDGDSGLLLPFQRLFPGPPRGSS